MKYEHTIVREKILINIYNMQTTTTSVIYQLIWNESQIEQRLGWRGGELRRNHNNRTLSCGTGLIMFAERRKSHSSPSFLKQRFVNNRNVHLPDDTSTDSAVFFFFVKRNHDDSFPKICIVLVAFQVPPKMQELAFISSQKTFRPIEHTTDYYYQQPIILYDSMKWEGLQNKTTKIAPSETCET